MGNKDTCTVEMIQCKYVYRYLATTVCSKPIAWNRLPTRYQGTESMLVLFPAITRLGKYVLHNSPAWKLSWPQTRGHAQVSIQQDKCVSVSQFPEGYWAKSALSCLPSEPLQYGGLFHSSKPSRNAIVCVC